VIGGDGRRRGCGLSERRLNASDGKKPDSQNAGEMAQ
jgi:hypothetical protein